VKKYCLQIMKALREKGQDVQAEYAKGWLQPVHLLGAVCNEKHRQLVARLVLTLNGMGKHLQEAEVKPQGYVQVHLDQHIRDKRSDIADTMRAWHLGSTKAKMDEWIFLATAPECAVGVFAFTKEACPDLYKIYISMLFVGFSDNTVLEQYVSQYRTIQDLRMDSPVSS
jgi:hypothetical protein